MAYKKNSFKSVLGYNKKIFAYYHARIKIQSELLKTIKSVLPSSLSGHAHYCVIAEKKILLYTDSALWASQLRFYQQSILESVLRANKGSFNTIHIKIIPKTSKILDKKPKVLPSKSNITLILNQAETQSDTNLRNALHKLGCTLKKKSSTRQNKD